MNNDELVKALRCEMYGDDECENSKCKYWSELGCRNGVANRDAADAIERMIAEVDRKDKALQAWAAMWENEKGKLIDRICENCDTPPDVRLRVCEECPIVKPIREVFDE